MKEPDHFFGTIGVGVGFQSFDGLNSRVSNFSKYEGLRDHAGSLQLGWLKERNRVISVFNIIGTSSMSGDRHEKSSVIRSIAVGADAGYDLLKKERIMLYPMVGLGYEMFQAKFYVDNSSVDFDDVLESPAVNNSIRPVNFTNRFFNYRLGVGVQFISPKGQGSIGIQGGYTGSFSERSWKGGDNQSLGNAPEDRLSKFHVSLILGSRPMMMRK